MASFQAEPASPTRFDAWLGSVWYRQRPGPAWLWPLEMLFSGISSARRSLFGLGVLRQRHPGVPVIVVGNIAVGGAGKTPVVSWLAAGLRDAGFNPGIVSRGYGGDHRGEPLLVRGESDPALCGDEPVLLASQTGCPVAVCQDRYVAAIAVVSAGANVVLSDDGLQHYRLARDVEIAVVDAERGVGNGARLPRGPLREPLERLDEVDFVFVNGGTWNSWSSGFRLAPGDVVSLDGTEQRVLNDFSGRKVHALAGIGHPARFHQLLEDHGIVIQPVHVPDHGRLAQSAFETLSGLPVLMTAKDAVKYDPLCHRDAWVVEVHVEANAKMQDALEKIVARLQAQDS